MSLYPIVSDGRGADRCHRSGWRRSRHSRSSSSVGSRTRRFGNQFVGDSEMFGESMQLLLSICFRCRTAAFHRSVLYGSFAEWRQASASPG